MRFHPLLSEYPLLCIPVNEEESHYQTGEDSKLDFFRQVTDVNAQTRDSGRLGRLFWRVVADINPDLPVFAAIRHLVLVSAAFAGVFSDCVTLYDLVRCFDSGHNCSFHFSDADQHIFLE